MIEISPSEPIYYGYIFSKQADNSSVIVRVESDNDICMTVSIQNTSVSREILLLKIMKLLYKFPFFFFFCFCSVLCLI